MKKLLIGIAGRARSGKTTCANILSQGLELRPYVIALPVTLACAAALGMEHNAFLSLPKTELLPPLNMTKREFMQTMGDALIRKNPHALINHLEHRMQAEQSRVLLFNGQLVCDIRTENEAEWLRAKGGTLIHIESLPKEQSDHRTEQPLLKRDDDITLKNTDSLEMFLNKCDLLIDHILHQTEKA